MSYYYNPVVKYLTKDRAPKDALVTIDNRFAKNSIMNGDYFEYYMDIEKVQDVFPKAYTEVQKYGGMALDGLSNYFYSNEDIDREELYEIYDHLLDKKIPMYNPNLIMLENTSRFLTMPLLHERLKFFTDSVPFLQIALSGYLPYYSSYLNFSANMSMDVLKVIDYGSYPSYLITKQPSHLLTNTMSRGFYGSYYGNLNDYIINNYHYINDALKNVVGHEIVSRNVITDGVVVVKYDNGYEIFINYTHEVYDNQNGIVVDPVDYLVVGS